MGRRKVGLSLALGFGVALVAISVASASGPDVVDLDYNHKSKKVAGFKHAEHVKRVHDDCKTCHHTGEEKACHDCHGAKKDGSKPAIKDAYHKNCKGCHKDHKKGPTKCKGCH